MKPARQENFFERLKRVIQEEPLLSRVLSLVWTAGPITFAALALSYWLVHRQLPPQHLLLYFAGYTALTGILSIVVNLIQKAAFKDEQERIEKALFEVITKIPDLIGYVMNQKLSQSSPEESRIYSAIVLLRDPDATEPSIQTALLDLTDQKDLAQAFWRIESFRQKGLYQRIEQERHHLEAHYTNDLKELFQRSSVLEGILTNRLAGNAPTRRSGQRRSPHFLQNIIESVDEDQPELIRFEDAEEFLKLVLELLVGRRITVVRWRLRGEHPLLMAARQVLQQERELKRVKRKQRLLKYKILNFMDHQARDFLHGESEEAEHPFETQLARYPGFNDLTPLLTDDEPTIRSQAKELLRVNLELKRIKNKYRASERRLEKLENLYSSESVFLKQEGRRAWNNALKLEREKFGLSPKERNEIGKDLFYYFSHLITHPRRTRLLKEMDEYQGGEERVLKLAELNSLFLRILNVFEQRVDLSGSALMESFEASRGITLSSISQGLPKRTKEQRIYALVDELEENENEVSLQSFERFLAFLPQKLSNDNLNEIAREHHVPYAFLKSRQNQLIERRFT